eukprot:scaffold9969_cov67-Phaeocystis_antarctica.AAC.1
MSIHFTHWLERAGRVARRGSARPWQASLGPASGATRNDFDKKPTIPARRLCCALAHTCACDQHRRAGKAIASPIAGTVLAASSVALVLAPSPEPARSAASSRLARRQRTALDARSSVASGSLPPSHTVL